MIKYMIIVLATTLFIVSLSAEDGLAKPFGFRRGMTYEELKEIDPNIKRRVEDSYYLRTAPLPYSMFEGYLVKIHDTEGLYFIRAFTFKTICDDLLKHEYKQIVEGITAVYGEPAPADSRDSLLRSESAWDELSFWQYLLDLDKGSVEFSIWEEANIRHKGLDNIVVSFWKRERRNETGDNITIDYFFKGFKQLNEEGKEKPQY